MESFEKGNILEFYGIAGGGKTTLVKSLIETTLKGKNVANISDATLQFNKNKFRNFIKYINWKLLLDSIKLYFCLENFDILEFKNCLVISKMAMVYSYAVTQFDLLIVDHGVCQQILHLLGYQKKDISKNSKKIIANILRRINNTTFVFCDLNEDEALRRIQKRSRQTGSIDIEKDKEIKKQMLRCMYDNCLVLRDINSDGHKAITLDMSQSNKRLQEIIASMIDREV